MQTKWRRFIGVTLLVICWWQFLGYWTCSSLGDLGKGRYLVYDCSSQGCGGWADRLEGITSTYLLALATDRQFGIHFSDPDKLERFLSPNQVNWVVNPILISCKSVLYNYIDNPPFHHSLTDLDFDKQHPEDVVSIKMNVINWKFIQNNTKYTELLNEFKNQPLKSVFPTIHNRIFSFPAHLQQTLETFRRSVKSEKDQPLVCAHIRTGNFVSEDKIIDNMGINAVLDYMGTVKSNARYFVASDKVEVVEQAATRFGSQFVHIEGPINHIDRYSVHEDKIGGFNKTMTDFYALTMCDILILSNSCFSSLAAFLRGRDEGLFTIEDRQVVKVDLAFVEKQYYQRVGLGT